MSRQKEMAQSAVPIDFIVKENVIITLTKECVCFKIIVIQSKLSQLLSKKESWLNLLMSLKINQAFM